MGIGARTDRPSWQGCCAPCGPATVLSGRPSPLFLSTSEGHGCRGGATRGAADWLYLTVPDKDGFDGSPSWEKIDVLDVGEIWEILDDAIEERCKAENAKRRRATDRKKGSQ